MAKSTAKLSPFAPARLPDMPVVPGVRLAACEAGIRYQNRTDLMAAVLDPGTVAAGVLTQSKTCSAPVLWCRANLPHGKARAVDRMMAACAVSTDGVDFEAADAEPASLFILLVSPESTGTPHVKVLANISRLLKEESVRKSLRESGSANAFLTVIRAAEAKYLATTST